MLLDCKEGLWKELWGKWPLAWTLWSGPCGPKALHGQGWAEVDNRGSVQSGLPNGPIWRADGITFVPFAITLLTFM